MGDSKKSEHSGHRERLRRRFIDNGLDGFEEHQALELYLFYAIPRRDTNPLAHRLLERYRNIGGVCDAPIDELERDFGLSESAAALLKLLPEMSRLYNESKLSDTNLIDPETVGDMIARRFIGRTSEAVALLLGSAKGKILYFDIVAKGSLAIRHNARTAYIAHNHPSGSLLPSRADIDVTKLLDSTLSSVGVHLLDHFIVADNEYASLREYDLI